ncbi:hypothetical protein FGKAn22_21780 [Ferrigenium kumadai]|uniref:Alpha-2-macroglobulin n=1 Tax=Ferrigenium kumadai TaxID=1682490 RepID=A0AAN1T1Q9_9PROT|nr:hypothetical protein [Ferrigenium kumadai]BBJ00486.1 hypothetical protein FGKAn22_21780 [Ferrigenium kumadai]
MRLICLLAAILLATAQTAYAEDWLSHYYEHPTPERFVTEVHALSKAGNLSNPKTAALISVFLGRVIAANPTQVDSWLTQLGDLKGGDRQTVLFAASLSGTKEAQAYLSRQSDAEKYLGKPIDIRALEPNNPTFLDMLWADFFATGEAVPIRRIVVALNYDKYSGALERYAKSEKTEKDRNDAILEAVFKAAMWSLESNARQHRRVGEILEQTYFSGGLTQPEQVWLSAILAKAMPEKYELTRTEVGQWTFKRKSTVQGTTGWRDSGGKSVAETESMKSKDDFGGSLLATTDEDWEKKWNTPPETKPNFNRAGIVPYGKKIYILTFFANPKLDQQGKANVLCDFRIFAPTGKVSLEQKDVTCFTGTIQGSPSALRLSAPVVAFSGDPNDPAGTWSVEVMLRDAVRNVELPLRTTFELRRP